MQQHRTLALNCCMVMRKWPLVPLALLYALLLTQCRASSSERFPESNERSPSDESPDRLLKDQQNEPLVLDEREAPEPQQQNVLFLDEVGRTNADEDARRFYDDGAKLLSLRIPGLYQSCITFGIKLGIKTSGPSLKGNPPNMEILCRFAGFIKNEIELYPKEFFKTLNLTHIYFVQGLIFDDGEAPVQKRYAVPHVTNEDVRTSEKHLYLDPSPLDRTHELQYWAEAFHHELHHLVEYTIDGEYACDGDLSQEFVKLNAIGKFAYVNSGAESREDINFRFKVGYDEAEFPQGKTFITNYAQAAFEEDKAEIFALYVLDPKDVINRYCNHGGAEKTVVWQKLCLIRKRMHEFGLDPRVFWNKCDKRSNVRKKLVRYQAEWTPAIAKSGDIFYIHKDGKMQWEKPEPEWNSAIDSKSGNTYWYHADGKRTQWETPELTQM